ncbi:MAG: omptin family outer membrane protease [Candidatus Omnitrophota bacterium]
MKKYFLAAFVCVNLLSGLTFNAIAAQSEQNWEFKLDSKYFFASHTSYQFGNPYIGSDMPLSRLEFPINNLWMGAGLRRNFARYSIGINALSSAMRNTRGRMKDSDWENTDDLSERTIFSTSANRMNYGIIAGGDVDLKVSDWLNFAPSLDIRPLVGFQWQKFSFTVHDGVQHYYSPSAPDDPLPGNLLDFEQVYWQYFAGFRSSWDMGRPFKLPPLKLLTEFHGGYVTGYNKDHHLLKGDRYTFETTDGYCFYASLGLEAQLTKNISLGTGIDYLMIRTTGKHNWRYNAVGVDSIWNNGVKVYSDQIGINLNLTYRF